MKQITAKTARQLLEIAGVNLEQEADRQQGREDATAKQVAV